MAAYEQSVEELHRAPLSQFIAERKRLAAKLRDAGEKAAATELAKRRRPTAAAWTVNQLYWRAREAFDDLLKAASHLRKGDLSAASEHREAMATLRKRAASILKEEKRGAIEPTLRRVTTTLAAIAAAGSFAPDPPGALAAERDAPGFEAFGIAADDAVRARPSHDRRADPARRHGMRVVQGKGAKPADGADTEERRSAADAKRRAAEQAEQKRRAAELARRSAERDRLEAKLRTAKGTLARHERTLTVVQKELRAAEDAVAEAQTAVQDIERSLEELDDDSD